MKIRFFEKGPEISHKLRKSCAEGDVVFFCGAGVSQSVGIPGFPQLTDKLIDILDPAPNSTVRKLISFYHNKNHLSAGIPTPYADLYQELYEEFGEAQVENEMSKVLCADSDKDPWPHRLLIELSRNEKGPQIITTNTDNLFQKECSTGFEPPNLPGPNFTGIVYLHGKWKKPDAGFERKNYIFSSADFGRAYLSEGWATRFIKELLFSGKTIVFVGYSADDPPIKFLLQALHADGHKYPLYAFASYKEDNGSPEMVHQAWQNKGVQVMPYPSSGADHSALWDSIKEWCNAKNDPERWKSEMTNLAQSQPNALPSFERQQIIEWVSTFEGKNHFNTAENPPPVAWLSELTEMIDYIPNWYCKFLNDPSSAQWWVGQKKISESLLKEIQWHFEVQKTEISQEAEIIWNLLIQGYESRGIDLSHECREACRKIGMQKNQDAALLTLNKCLKPKLKIDKPFHLFTKPTDPLNWKHTGDIANFSIEFPFHKSAISKLDPSKMNDPALIHAIFRIFINALELSARLLNQIPENRCNWNIADLPNGKKNNQSPALEATWLKTVEFIDSLYLKAPEKVRSELIGWPEKEPFFFDKLRLYTWSHNSISARKAFEGIQTIFNTSWNNTNLSSQWIQTLSARWSEFDLNQCKAIETMICSIFVKNKKPTEKDYINWLHAKEFYSQLKHAGIDFQKDTMAIICSEMPEKLKPIAEASTQQFRNTVESLGIKSLPMLKDLSLDLFKEAVKSSPMDALQRLKSTSGDEPDETIIPFWATLALLDRADHSREDRREIASALLSLPESIQLNLTPFIPRWFEYHLHRHAEMDRDEALQWWDQYYGLLIEQTDDFHLKPHLSGHDHLSNSSFHHLSQAPLYMMINILILMKDHPGKRLEAALQLKGLPKAQIICAMAYHLKSLFETDKEWTEQYLIPLFSSDHQEAAWGGFYERKRFATQCNIILYPSLLPHFLQASHYCTSWNWSLSAVTRFARLFVRTDFRKLIPKSKIRSLIRNLGIEGQSEIIERLSHEDLFNQATVSSLITQWPNEKKFKTDQLSSALVNALMHTRDDFPKMLELVLPFLSPIVKGRCWIDQSISSGHPEESLRMLERVVPDRILSNSWHNLNQTLDTIGTQMPKLKQLSSFRRLQNVIANI